MRDILECLFVFGASLAVPVVWYISMLQNSFEERQANKALFGEDCCERWERMEREKSRRFWKEFLGLTA